MKPPDNADDLRVDLDAAGRQTAMRVGRLESERE